MSFPNSQRALRIVAQKTFSSATWQWLQEQLTSLKESRNQRKLYLAYSKVAREVNAKSVALAEAEGTTADYLRLQRITPLELARLYLLSELLGDDGAHWQPAASKLIEVADTGELVTFLKYLPLLPGAGAYVSVAVEALRTNISTVFDAISQGNPYPADYFNDQQWNQMFLKAAFMQQDLAGMVRIDERANGSLARIISDYAHERWAAGRDVDPLFWRPTTRFLEGDLLTDMERLLRSDNPRENRAGALCCYQSDKPAAKELLDRYPEFKAAVSSGSYDWSGV